MMAYQEALSVLESVCRQNIPFVVVGGAAMALHGIPRSTLDIDIAVPSRTEVITRLFETAQQVGLKSSETGTLELAEKPDLLTGQWITFEDSEGCQLLDVLLEDEPAFDGLSGRAVTRELGDQTLKVASLDDIEAMKRAVGRPIDISDIALINEVRRMEDK